MPGVAIGDTSWSLRLDDHVSCLAASPSRELLVAGSLGGDVVLLDTATGSVTAKLPSHPLGVLAAAWSHDGDLVATGGQDGTLRICGADGDGVAELATGAWVQHLAWSPLGVVAASAGRHLLLVDRDGRLRHRYPAVSSTITALHWSTGWRRVGVTSYGGITWFDVDRIPADTPSRRHAFHGSPIGLALAPSGKWACAGYQDASIHLWPLWSGNDLAMSGYPAKIEHLAFRDDSRWLASACMEELTVWDFSGKGPQGTRPAVGTAHRSRITWLGWQPGGTVLATGDAEGTVVVWPSPASVSRPLRPLDHAPAGAAVATATWLPAGHGIVVGRHDGAVELRPVNAPVPRSSRRR